MTDHSDSDFYQSKDEAAFLDAWETKYGPLDNESNLEKLYQEIALDIHEKIQNHEHKLGDKYYYQDVFVGYSDYSAFNKLYLFSRSE